MKLLIMQSSPASHHFLSLRSEWQNHLLSTRMLIAEAGDDTATRFTAVPFTQFIKLLWGPSFSCDMLRRCGHYP
jgi:hypothetical protein